MDESRKRAKRERRAAKKTRMAADRDELKQFRSQSAKSKGS